MDVTNKQTYNKPHKYLFKRGKLQKSTYPKISNFPIVYYHDILAPLHSSSR